MRTDHTSSEAMRAYLLGRLPQDQASALEEEYFVNRPFLLKLQSEEAALIEDYLNGSLGQAEKQSFEKQYLQLPELRRKVEEAQQQRRRVLVPAAKPPLWASWRLSLTAALVLVLGVGVWIYFVWAKNQTQQAIHARETIPPQPSIQMQQPPKLTASLIYLSPGRTQGDRSSTLEFPQPLPNSAVILALELPGESSAVKRTVQISMVKANGSMSQIWTSPGLVASAPGTIMPSDFFKTIGRPTPSRQTLTLSLPASLFQPGDYVVRVSTQTGTHDTYLYRVLPS